MKFKNAQKWLKSEFNISTKKSFIITKENLVKSKNRIPYNKKVNIECGEAGIKGVYVWSKPDSDEIIYVGMSGKLIWTDESKTKVLSNSHTVQKRLISSRGRHNVDGQITKVELTTYRYLKEIVFKKEKIDKLKVSVFEVDTEKHSPTYIESCLLQKIYSKEGLIPMFNKSF